MKGKIQASSQFFTFEMRNPLISRLDEERCQHFATAVRGYEIQYFETVRFSVYVYRVSSGGSLERAGLPRECRELQILRFVGAVAVLPAVNGINCRGKERTRVFLKRRRRLLSPQRFVEICSCTNSIARWETEGRSRHLLIAQSPARYALLNLDSR